MVCRQTIGGPWPCIRHPSGDRYCGQHRKEVIKNPKLKGGVHLHPNVFAESVSITPNPRLLARGSFFITN
jgi:hypothetical protein